MPVANCLAEVETDLAERRVARLDEALFERAAAPLAAEVLAASRCRERERELGEERELLVDVDVVGAARVDAVTVLNVEPGG